MAERRKQYGAASGAKGALEAIQGEATVAELVSRHGVHQTLISSWKRQAVDGMAGVFSNKADVAAAERAGAPEKLHSEIGRPVGEREYSAKASPGGAG